MSLQSYVDSFRIEAPTSPVMAGMPINLAAVAGEILDVPTTEVVTAPVDLQFVIKHLQLPAGADEIGWPPLAAVTGALANLTAGLARAPLTPNPDPPPSPAPKQNLEAWAGTLSGTVPVGLRDIAGTIRVDYLWHVSVEPGSGPTDRFEVTGGSLTSPALTIALPPVMHELDQGDFSAAVASAERVKSARVQLEVTARIGTSQTASFTTPPVSIPIVPIPLPSVGALFRDNDFGGDRAIVTVPDGSPIASAPALLQVLEPLRDLLGALRSAAAATSWAVGVNGLYDTVDALVERVPVTEHLAFRIRNAHDDLGSDDFVDGFWGNYDIENLGSSVLIVSPTRSLSFFEHDSFKGERLTLDARVDGSPNRIGGAAVRRLHVPVPQSVPFGCVEQSGAPDNNWGNKISSYRWNHPL